MINFFKHHNWLNKKYQTKFNYQIWLLLVIFVFLSVLALLRSFNDLNLISLGYESPYGIPVKRVEEIYGRNGNITAISGNLLVVSVDKINKSGSEDIEVAIEPSTEILEIRIPEYLSSKLRKKMLAGEDIIARVKTQPDRLFIGQRVLVVSQDNMVGQKKVTGSRIEYTVIIQSS